MWKRLGVSGTLSAKDPCMQNLHAVSLPFIGDLFWSSQGDKKIRRMQQAGHDHGARSTTRLCLGYAESSSVPPLWKFLILWLEVKCLLDFLSKCYPN